MWMDLEIVILCEVSQPEKDKYMILLIYGISKKGYNYKIRNRVTDTEDNLWSPGNKRGGRRNWEIGMDIYTPLHREQN